MGINLPRIGREVPQAGLLNWASDPNYGLDNFFPELDNKIVLQDKENTLTENLTVEAEILADKVEVQGVQILDDRRVRNVYLLQEGSSEPVNMEDGDLVFYYEE